MQRRAALRATLDGMVWLPLDVALSVLTISTCLVAVQLIIVTVEIEGLRRDVKALLLQNAQKAKRQQP